MTPEQQRALALARARRRRADAEKARGERGGLAFANQGIASMLGAPVDLLNAGMGAIGLPVSDTPFGGSRSIQQGMEAIGIRPADPSAQPETFGEYVGQGVGSAVGALVPGSGIVGMASRAASPLVRESAKAVARPFAATPKRALASEMAAGAGSGAGMATADAMAPDNEVAKLAGALVGGGIGGMGPMAAGRVIEAAPVTGTAINVVRREVAPFTKAGAMEVARRRVGRLVEDRDAALANLDTPSVSEISPAVQTGDRRLMALEKSVRSQEPVADLAMREAETAASATLRDELGAPARGVGAEAARQWSSQRVANFVANTNRRIAEAEKRASDKLAVLGPRRSQADASIIVREELESALSAARQQENLLWHSVPEQVAVPTQAARAAYRDIAASLPRAQRADMPEAARRFLGGDGNETFRATESVREMHGLYSQLRRDARNARAGDTPNFNQARIADELADAILRDMTDVASVSGPLREALSYSRFLNETFSRGSIGRVLGNERTGASRVADIQTLDRTIGRGGRSGAVGMDEVNRAVGTDGASPRAMGDYMAGRFFDAAVRDGQVRPGPAQTFMASNRDVLDRMPQTQQQIADAIAHGSAARRVRGSMEGRAANVQNNSAASVLTGARPGQEISAILRSPNPRQTANQLARQARRDPTGQAPLGLKRVLLDDLMAGARRADFDESGTAMISGRAIKARLQDGPFLGIAEEFLTSEELSRVRQIADEFAKIETMQGQLPDAGPIMGDKPNSIIDYLMRVTAARAGAKLGQGTSGASLQTAQMASSRMRRTLQFLTNDRAEKLIIQAIMGDRDLFRALLTPPNQLTRQQENRIIETISGMTAAAMADGTARSNEDRSGSNPGGPNRPLQITVTEANPIQ